MPTITLPESTYLRADEFDWNTKCLKCGKSYGEHAQSLCLDKSGNTYTYEVVEKITAGQGFTRGYKVRVNEKTSHELQKTFFKAGGRWADGSSTFDKLDQPYLYFSKAKKISLSRLTYGISEPTFVNNSNTEILPSELFRIIVNGDKSSAQRTPPDELSMADLRRDCFPASYTWHTRPPEPVVVADHHANRLKKLLGKVMPADDRRPEDLEPKPEK